MRSRRSKSALFAVLSLLPLACSAGPPYVSDDPEPTDHGHYEIYFFAQGSGAQTGREGETGIDFNYGGGDNLQLTAVLPLAFDDPAQGRSASGVGNIELAAKYRFLHKDDIGWDVAVFPRVFVPSASRGVGDQHLGVLLPIWLQREFDGWTTFGGGGCELHRGGNARDFCLAGWAVTREVTKGLTLGAELVRQGADTRDGHASTRLGLGATYDFSERWHLLAAAGPGLELPAETGRYAWYVSLLFTR
jgi:hypothetical protein